VLQMNSSEQLKLDVISRVHAGKISFKHGARILAKSESTLFRYLRGYKKRGAVVVKHGNSHKKPYNRMAPDLEKRILSLCRSKYHDFNRTHAREELEKNEQIIVLKDTFNRLCNRHGLLKKNTRRKKHIARSRRERMSQLGLMLQLDGSPHRWFGVRKTCLVIAIDDATGDILYGEFSPTETTFACMNVVKKVLRDHGVFQLLYTDRAGIFGKDPINQFYAVKREGFSALRKSLSHFNIHVIYAFSAEAKGRVERAFRTLQDRLVAEMRLHEIWTIQEANRYFNEIYLPRHRELFAKNPSNPESAFVPLVSTVDLDELFYMSEVRVVRNDHTFLYKNRIYDIENGGENYAGNEIEIRSYPEGQVRYFIDDKEVQLRKSEEKIA